MATVVGQSYRYPLTCAKKEKVVLTAVAVNTAGTGAINQNSSRYSDPAIVITRTGVGTYSVTYPACPGDVLFNVMVHFNSGTVNIFDAQITAYSATAGTATITTYGATQGTAADGNAGCEIHLELVAEMRAGN